MCHPHQPIKLDFTNTIQWHNFIVTVLLSIGPAYFIPAAIHLFQWNEHTLAIMQSTVKKRIFDFIDNMTYRRYGARATKQKRANKTNILVPTPYWISQRQHKRQTANIQTITKYTKNRKVRT